ncbi:MAG: cysteine--tRNA ligase [Candidatus Taylorbacteria bacterium]|nr:cysteine--tRNA ligase [Candidatus Taylorbacteria bacterium]
MSLYLFNTLTGKKEEFKSLKNGEVGIYTCGPTVYNYAHIGNLRAYVFADVLRRTFEYNGYKVKQVMNITDVGQLTSDADDGDDKMVKGLKRDGKPLTLEAMSELGEFYTKTFIEDLKALNIKLPHEMPRASKHIKEDIEIIERLLDKGVAYRITDGIYFDISKFPSYGTRGGFKLGELKEGARVAVNFEKRSPRDFSLWKFSDGAIGWDASFGRGFPGWHIECSAMSRKYLGQPFDVHTGGIDHVPVHHQNEIAQSEAAYDAPLANVWMHNEFLNMSDGKMAKSGENYITLQALKERGIHPLAYRYYLLQSHYRSPVNFSWEALEAAQRSTQKSLEFLSLNEFLLKMNTPITRIVSKNQPHWSVADWEKNVEAALSNDLDTPKLITLMHEAIENYNPKETARWELINKVDKILGLGLYEMAESLVKEMNTVPADIKKLASAREEARKTKDFKKSDELRYQIQKEGFEVMDTDSGPIVRKII